MKPPGSVPSEVGSIVLNLILFAAAVYGLLVLFLFIFQRSLLFPADGHAPDRARGAVPDFQVVSIPAQDGTPLLLWMKEPEPGKPVVLYFHGNAGSIEGRAYKARRLADAGYGVVLAEYRGYAGQPGVPSEEAFLSDAWDVYRFASKDAGPLVVYGESLGTGVATGLAARLAGEGTPIKGLILEAPFTSVADAAQHHYPYVPAKWLVRDRFDSSKRIAGINAPLLILHGDQDRTVPQKFGRRLFDAAVEPKTAAWIDGAGHVDVFEAGGDLAVLSFLNDMTVND